MFYVIETHYTGSNSDQFVDTQTIEIRTSPAITNSSREIRLSGWCGTSNDRAVYAYGEYDTIEAARAKIVELFGEVRNSDAEGNPFESDDETVVEIYKPGKFVPLSLNDTIEWLFTSINSDVNADTTDERIRELVAVYEAEANTGGNTLHEGIAKYMRGHRQELRDLRND